MGKRVSGPPRRPRNPVAKAVRTPVFRQRVVPDKRGRPPAQQDIEGQLEEVGDGEAPAKEAEGDDADV